MAPSGQNLKLLKALIFRHFGKLSALEFQNRKPCLPRLRQVVSRQVLNAEPGNRVELALPVGGGHSGQAVNQINADVAESGLLAIAHSINGLLRSVATVHQRQHFIVERLNADAQAVGVDAQVGRCKPVSGRRVGFNGDFCIGRHAVQLLLCR